MSRLISILLFLIPAALSAQSKPNIIFIWADDMGMGEVNFSRQWWGGSPGYYETATPNIDSLARNGAFFSNFRVRPVCTPSRIAFMTGKHPFRIAGNGDYGVNWPRTSPPFGLSQDEKTLPEYLQENGYVTAHFGKWHLGCSLPEHAPVRQGFNYSFGSNFAFASQRDYVFQGIHNFTRNSEKYTAPAASFESEIVSDTALAWIATQMQDETSPFFVYYCFTNIHDDAFGSDSIPYIPAILAQAPSGTTDQKQKWASIKDIDNVIGEIWQAVRDAGQENNTILIFTTDNGADESNAPDNYPFAGSKLYSYEGGVRVPFIWYQPGVIDSMSIDSTTCVEDMLPTFLGILGEPSPSGIDGIDLSPLLRGEGLPVRTWYGPLIPGRTWSIVQGRWKAGRNFDASVTSANSTTLSHYLFDIENDPGETTNLATTYPSILQVYIDLVNEISTTERTVNTSAITGPRWYGDPVYYYNAAYLHSAYIQDYKE